MAYATLADLILAMGITNPPVAQQEALQRALDAAAQEINVTLGWTGTPPAAVLPGELAIVKSVNVDRAKELYQPPKFGMLQQGPETPATPTARDSWRRHYIRLLAVISSDTTTRFGVG